MQTSPFIKDLGITSLLGKASQPLILCCELNAILLTAHISLFPVKLNLSQQCPLFGGCLCEKMLFDLLVLREIGFRKTMKHLHKKKNILS